MVRLVQLVEHQIVVLGVVGSSPTSHPKERLTKNYFLASLWPSTPAAPVGDMLIATKRTVFVAINGNY